MRPISAVLVGTTLLFNAACSIYPLPLDVVGYDTKDIVTKIRCEARDAIRDSAIYYLSQLRGPVNNRGQSGSDYAKELDQHRFMFEKAAISDLTGKAKTNFDYYKNSQIAYEFTLRGLESNTQGFDLGLDRKFGLRKDTLGFKSEVLRSRDVTRTFFVWDKFEKLIKLEQKYCDEAKSINIVYPIVGSLPIRDLLFNYIELNQLKILATRSAAKDAQLIVGTEEAPAIPAMGDTMVFKTRLDGNITPSFNYNPAGMGLLVSSLTLKDENYRDDTHTVVLTVSTAPESVVRTKLAGKPKKGPPSDNARLDAARESVAVQQTRRLQDAIINLSTSIGRIAQ